MIFARHSVTRHHCEIYASLSEDEAFLTPNRALVGFLLSLTPLSCDLMGFRGAGGNGAASTGVFFFFGGLLMILGSLGEVRTTL